MLFAQLDNQNYALEAGGKAAPPTSRVPAPVIPHPSPGPIRPDAPYAVRSMGVMPPPSPGETVDTVAPAGGGGITPAVYQTASGDELVRQHPAAPAAWHDPVSKPVATLKWLAIGGLVVGGILGVAILIK